MSDKKEKSDKNINDKEENSEDQAPPNDDTNNPNQTNSSSPETRWGGEKQLETEEEEIHTSKATVASARSSHYFVLIGDSPDVGGNICHVPRLEGVNVRARRKLIIASVLCLIFVAVEVVGGVISNSLAVAADAAHTLTDFAGFMISLLAIWLAGRHATERFTFGWHRAEIIGALASIMSIWFVTAVLVWLAIERCITHDFEIDAPIMVITASFGIVTNIVLAIILMWGTSTNIKKLPSNEDIRSNLQQTQSRQWNIAHSHGHSHGCGGGEVMVKVWRKLTCQSNTIRNDGIEQGHDTARVGDSVENINVRSAILHVVGDGLQSCGVLVAGIVIYFREDWAVADPICTFFFSIIILYTTLRALKDILLVLMEGTPTYFDYKEVQRRFKSIDGVKSVHGLRIWALSIERIALAVHLVIEPGVNPKVVLRKAQLLIHQHYNLHESTIQIEESE